MEGKGRGGALLPNPTFGVVQLGQGRIVTKYVTQLDILSVADLRTCSGFYIEGTTRVQVGMALDATGRGSPNIDFTGEKK